MTIDLYPEIIRAQDLSPDQGFGSEIDDDCQVRWSRSWCVSKSNARDTHYNRFSFLQMIEEATKGWGANKQLVIDAIATKDATERWKLSKRYEELFNKKLEDLMKKEFSGDFAFAMRCLAMPLDQAECFMIKKATDGVGCSVKIVYSVMCGRTNAELELLKKNYFKLYTKDIGQLLASELHGDMERLVINSMQAGEEKYDPQYHTADKVNEDAEEIYKKGQGKWFGTDEKSIFKLLCAAPPEHVENINRAYSDKYGYTLLKAMEKELSGNARDGTLHMLGMKLKPAEVSRILSKSSWANKGASLITYLSLFCLKIIQTAAKLIKAACAGIGTDEALLTCCLIRYQHVMKDVMAAHIEMYGKSVHDRVRSEAGGPYKTVLLAILNAVWPEEGY